MIDIETERRARVVRTQWALKLNRRDYDSGTKSHASYAISRDSLLDQAIDLRVASPSVTAFNSIEVQSGTKRYVAHKLSDIKR